MDLSQASSELESVQRLSLQLALFNNLSAHLASTTRQNEWRPRSETFGRDKRQTIRAATMLRPPLPFARFQVAESLN
jgi:hypothetical protein